MDGDAVAREMKRIQPFVPVIMLTAHPSDVRDELPMLVNKCLSKGEDPVVLLTMIGSTAARVPFSNRHHTRRSSVMLFKSCALISPASKCSFRHGGNGELRPAGCRGFNPEAARFWEWVRTDSQRSHAWGLVSE